MSHKSSQTFMSRCAHISDLQSARVGFSDVTQLLSDFGVTLRTHLRIAESARVSISQTLVSRCAHISDLQVRAPRLHRCHSTSLRLCCLVVHTSLFVKCMHVDSADVTQLLTDFGVTLRTHLSSSSACMSTRQMSLSNFQLTMRTHLRFSESPRKLVSNFHTSLHTHLRSASARASITQMSLNLSQTLVSRCAHISDPHTRACQVG
jgi:hypothetical protein